MTTLVTDVRLFDGLAVTDRASVLFGTEGIIAVGNDLTGDEVVDGRGMTLLPGLLDAHVHAKEGAQEQALAFGVTTELDMGSDPDWMVAQRAAARDRFDLADIRSSSFGATVLTGWPSGAIGIFFPRQFPVVAELSDVAVFVEDRVAEGADYIKLFIDDGSALGLDVPTLSPELSTAIVAEAHARGLKAVAHAITLHGAEQAVASGVDGLVHIFMDKPPTPSIVESIAAAGIFVVPTLSALGAMAGDRSGEALARDPRTEGLVAADWAENLCSCSPGGAPGRLEHAMAAVAALHDAGVTILAGTDSACIGVLGTAHGISVHGELGLLVESGLSPLEALRAATSATTAKFGLDDRGLVRAGLRADLLLVEGDPTTTISDSLSIRQIWRGGVALDRAAYQASLAGAS